MLWLAQIDDLGAVIDRAEGSPIAAVIIALVLLLLIQRQWLNRSNDDDEPISQILTSLPALISATQGPMADQIKQSNELLASAVRSLQAQGENNAVRFQDMLNELRSSRAAQESIVENLNTPGLMKEHQVIMKQQEKQTVVVQQSLVKSTQELSKQIKVVADMVTGIRNRLDSHHEPLSKEEVKVIVREAVIEAGRKNGHQPGEKQDDPDKPDTDMSAASVPVVGAAKDTEDGV